MENASKAIIMAGGILIAIIIMSLLVMLFSQIGSVYGEEGNSKAVEQLEEYNRKFALYERSLYGSELLSLANLVEEYEKSLIDGDIITTSNSITVTVKLDRNTIGYEGVEPKYSSLLNTNGVSLGKIKKYSDELEKKIKKKEDVENVKSSLTQLKSMPFQGKVTERKNGMITKMEFTQKYDSYIDKVNKYYR